MSDDVANELEAADNDFLDKAVSELMTHFDTVQIFATRSEGQKNTVRAVNGAGNWFARFGQIALWVRSETHIDIKESAEREEDN